VLIDEEIAKHGERWLWEMVPLDTVVSSESPGMYADNADSEAAVNLHQFIKEHEIRV